MDIMTRAGFAAWVLALVYSAHPEKGTTRMKHTLALIALLAAMACAVNASAAMVCTGNLCGETVSATQVASVVTFPGNPAGGGNQDQDAVVVENAGAVTIDIALNEAATTSKVDLPAGRVLTLTGKAARISTLGIICATGQTATVYVKATYP